jgi:PilZ domain
MKRGQGDRRSAVYRQCALHFTGVYESMGTLSTEWEAHEKSRASAAGKTLAEIVSAAFAQGSPAGAKGDDERFAVHWPISLAHRGGVLQSTTENIGCGGFFCYSNEEFVPGDPVRASIQIPHHGGAQRGCTFLLCRARVVRVELHPQYGYGVGCNIEDYNLVSG